MYIRLVNLDSDLVLRLADLMIKQDLTESTLPKQPFECVLCVSAANHWLY